YVTLVEAPLGEHRYPVSDEVFNWYDLEQAKLPDSIDMLVVDGPPGHINPDARYPAGPELFHKLSRDAHIFLDDANRPDEVAVIKLWRGLYPDLGVRSLPAEKGACELFFLDRKIEQFLS